MQKRAHIDKAGRVVIPKPLRDALGLRPGDSLVAEGTEEGITLRPAVDKPALRKERGCWVRRTGRPLRVSLPELIDAVRAERELGFLK